MVSGILYPEKVAVGESIILTPFPEKYFPDKEKIYLKKTRIVMTQQRCYYHPLRRIRLATV